MPKTCTLEEVLLVPISNAQPVAILCRGELLWPAKTLPPSASEICTRCGTELQFILQLTPALMHFIEEAVQWLEGSSAEDSPVPDWEWATVAVFGCRICMKASGNGKKLETGTSYEELSIAIFNE